jgi:hypothetical protein
MAQRPASQPYGHAHLPGCPSEHELLERDARVRRASLDVSPEPLLKGAEPAHDQRVPRAPATPVQDGVQWGSTEVEAVGCSARIRREACPSGSPAPEPVAGASCIPPAGRSATGQRRGPPGSFPTAARAESDGRPRSRGQPRQPARRTPSRHRQLGPLVTGRYGRGRVPRLSPFRCRPLTRGASRAPSGGPLPGTQGGQDELGRAADRKVRLSSIARRVGDAPLGRARGSRRPVKHQSAARRRVPRPPAFRIPSPAGSWAALCHGEIVLTVWTRPHDRRLGRSEYRGSRAHSRFPGSQPSGRAGASPDRGRSAHRRCGGHSPEVGATGRAR